MKKLGIERRVFTAGEHKAMLDPFMPLNQKDRTHVDKMLLAVHDEFIAVVKEGRGDALKKDPVLFSGRVWEGKTAKALGLIDEYGSASQVARDVVGAAKLVDFTRRQHWLDRLAGSIGTSIGNALATRLEQESLRPVH